MTSFSRPAWVLAALLASAAGALAADLPSIKEAPAPVAPAPQAWRFEASLNGFAPSLISEVGVRHLPTVDANLGFFKLLSKLNGVAPLSLTATNGQFLLGADLFWSRLGSAAQFERSTAAGLLPGNVYLQLGETILTGFAGYRLPIDNERLSLFGVAGARYFSVNADIGVNAPIAGLGLSQSQGRDWVDPIIGLVGRYRLDGKYFLTGEADIGGYAQNITWQSFGAVGYQLTPAVSATLGFRALYVDHEQDAHADGRFRFQQTLLGPQAALSYAF